MEFGENGAVISNKTQDKTSLDAPTHKHAFIDGPRSVTGLSRWAVYLLAAFIFAELIWCLVSSLLIWLYLPSTVVPFTQTQLASIDNFIVVSGLIHTLLFWSAAILVMRFTFRAMKNLHTIGSNFAEMSPAWAVGWYFVPFANLWQPAKGMSQIYNGTFTAVGESLPGESRIAIWWTFWVISNIATNISMRISGFDNMGAGVASFSFDLASSLFGLLSAWALIRLIRPTAEKQELLKHGSFAQVFD
ncbi:MAG: DUF4328 domain-containing protein [Pseudomonadota bacterium]